MSEPQCPILATLSMLSGKWKLLILRELLNGVVRFGELQRLIPGISAKVLSQQLREMEDDGLIERVAYPEVPPRVEYKLTEIGESTISIMKEIRRWGLFHLLNNAKHPVKCARCKHCEPYNC